ncbi:3'-kinase [Deinococcus cavernae]|uniref:3'-kinase n=1 Tax=Deinococcus cavernae TaxID=2320857 RepID=A0A418V665_9DEIO|nr:aminoglycoside phosphotransferase family protein [Deinococcus cavernae]RJF71591.1 3'-kinase [Deinococcus cavernae]
MFGPYLKRWKLVPDGAAIHTHSSDLLPVLYAGQPAMLKVTRSDEETTGNHLMVWLGGHGAARVYAQGGEAIVLERLHSEPSLTEMVKAGQDDDATRILCRAAAELHAVSRLEHTPPPPLPDLRRWFRSLERTAALGGVYATAWSIAQELLNDPQDTTALHGDLHHGNVLHSPARGWLLIDPKGLVGERGFDYANIFYNPTNADALRPGRLARQLEIVCAESGLERARLLRWVAAYGGLSAAWWLEHGDGQYSEARKVLNIVELALAALSVSG